MCTIFFAIGMPQNPLLILANRDEFYARPTQISQFWEESPQLLAGKDLQGGGTWLGVTTTGKYAFVTNYREAGGEQEQKKTRGKLVKDYLLNSDTPADYMQQVWREKDLYHAFNLVVGDQEQCLYFSNRVDQIQTLSHGVYGLSNRELNSDWPKVQDGMVDFKELLEKHSPDKSELWFSMMQKHRIYPDAVLPDTGVGIETERVLSSLFVKTPVYGTRAITLTWLDQQAHMHWIEKQRRSDKHWELATYSFPLVQT